MKHKRVKMDAIEVKDLVKRYGDVVAIDGVSFNVRKGEIFSLLGPNGAGKTTTIKSILGLIRIDGGEIKINGKDIFLNGKEAKKNIGYLPEMPSFYENLTALQTLQFFAELKGVDEDCMALLKEFGLEDAANRKVGTFSKGMMQRLALAQCLIGKPNLLILDEPASGLDAIGAYEVRKKIKELNKEGVTILFSSHILSEVQEISHRVAILNKGKIVAIDTIENLGKKFELHPKLRIELQRPSSYVLNFVKNVKGVEDAKMERNVIEVICNPAVKTNVIKAIEEAGGKIIDFKTIEPSLEEIFIKMVGENE
ncbi:MAG: ABC transporter ATP-binding protein [Thermoplasmata archaeon]|nr:ABC transporter ATP-binding protein [Thermoplasmata archaeon]